MHRISACVLLLLTFLLLACSCSSPLVEEELSQEPVTTQTESEPSSSALPEETAEEEDVPCIYPFRDWELHYLSEIHLYDQFDDSVAFVTAPKDIKKIYNLMYDIGFIVDSKIEERIYMFYYVDFIRKSGLTTNYSFNNHCALFFNGIDPARIGGLVAKDKEAYKDAFEAIERIAGNSPRTSNIVDVLAAEDCSQLIVANKELGVYKTCASSTDIEKTILKLQSYPKLYLSRDNIIEDDLRLSFIADNHEPIQLLQKEEQYYLRTYGIHYGSLFTVDSGWAEELIALYQELDLPEQADIQPEWFEIKPDSVVIM